MNVFPEIHTSRLFLSAFSETDATDVFRYCSNPNVSRFTSWATHKSVEDSLRWLRSIPSAEAFEVGKVRHCWAIRLRGEKVVIGAIEFTQTSLDKAHIDYFLAQEHWNKNLTTEAATGIINWAFQTLAALQTIESGGLTENFGSIRVMQKCGMTLQWKRLMRFSKFKDEEREVSQYAITRTEWAKTSPN